MYAYYSFLFLATVKTIDCILSSISSRDLFWGHTSSIFRQSSNPVSGFSMMEQVRLCAVWPTERSGLVLP